MRIISALRITGATVLSIGGLLIGTAGLAAAAPPNIVFVSKAGCANSGPGTHQKPFCTVQQGVNAVAPGGTVKIQDGGTYTEQVVITNKNNLTIQGFGSTIKMPTTGTAGGSIVDVSGSTGLRLSNLSIAGPFNVASCATDEYGVHLGAASETNMQDVRVTNVAPQDVNFFGCQQGVGIFVDAGAKATMRNVDVSGYAKVGIEVNGTGASATINQSKITGTPTNLTALNGIQVSRGATATLKQNTVTGNVYTKVDGYTASGVIIYQAGAVTASNNVLKNNDVGFDVEESNGSSYTQNSITDSTTNGFYVASGSSNNTFTRNSIKNTTGSTQYTPYDVEDDTTGTGTVGTANNWNHNSCTTSTPAGICKG